MILSIILVYVVLGIACLATQQNVYNNLMKDYIPKYLNKKDVMGVIVVIYAIFWPYIIVVDIREWIQRKILMRKVSHMVDNLIDIIQNPDSTEQDKKDVMDDFVNTAKRYLKKK